MVAGGEERDWYVGGGKGTLYQARLSTWLVIMGVRNSVVDSDWGLWY